MEIVEENLALIKNNYINNNDMERKNTTNNNYTKSNKETENKIKKKKYMSSKYKNNEFMKKSPLQTRPYQLPYSLDFINAVKFDKYDKLEELLDFPELLYSYDYYWQTGFHWAAKLGKIKALLMLLKCGNCINQTDINGFTPLALAAKYNNWDICQILCDSGANPLIPNNDGLLPKDLAKDIRISSYLSFFTSNYSKK